MTRTTSFQFVDQKVGESMATIEPTAGSVAITLATAGQPGNIVHLTTADAEKFAGAILAALGQDSSSRQLPQSRQIGGIIGPY